MTNHEAARVRACLDCGAPGAELVRSTRGVNPGRRLRVCMPCWLSGRWDAFGLVEREPMAAEVPTEYVDGAWRWPEHDSDPAAVVTYTTEPSPETGHVGWCWWARGAMGDAPTYEAACAAAVAALGEGTDRG